MEISLSLYFFSTYARLRFVFSSTIYDYNNYLLKKREREFELNNDLKYVVKSIGIAYYYY